MPINYTEDTSWNRPNIRIYTPLNMGGSFVGDYKAVAANYRQTKRLMGGYWSASFDLPGLPDESKLTFFNQRIGSHVVNKFGGTVVFEGLIWSMDLYKQGVRRRITLEDVRNKIRVNYNDLSAGTNSKTIWKKNNTSRARYGTMEEILYLDRIKNSDAAYYAMTTLQESSEPISYPIAFKEPEPEDEVTLSVEVVGYVYTLNYQYVHIPSRAYTIANAIPAVLSADAEFINQGHIANVSIEVAPPLSDIKAWDWLLELAQIGNGYAPHVLQVWNNRRFIYKELSPKPIMIWDGHSLKSRANRSLNKMHYSVKPGVIRDFTWPNQPLPNTMFLANRRDSIVTEVEAGESYTQPLLKTERYEDSELMAAFASNQVNLENILEQLKRNKKKKK